MPTFPRIDKYPQFVGFQITQTGTNADTEVRIQLPKYRFGTGATQSTVIIWEFLKAEIWPHLSDGDLSHNNAAITVTGSTASHFGRAGTDYFAYPNDGDCLFMMTSYLNDANRHFDENHPYRSLSAQDTIDFQFQDGRGQLVAVDDIFLQVHTVNFDAATTIRGRIWYRFVKANLAEYIGILQQQQDTYTEVVD